MKLYIKAVAYDRPIQMMNLCGMFLIQNNPNWDLTLMYDGYPPKQVHDIMSLFADERIHFTHSGSRNGKWGHPNRKAMIQSLEPDADSYVLITNDDNMYVPIFVDAMLSACKSDVGMVFCDTLHSYTGFTHTKSQLKENFIDMGAFIVRCDIAKEVGFNHEHFSADGRYAEECAKYCSDREIGIRYIDRPLFIHC